MLYRVFYRSAGDCFYGRIADSKTRRLQFDENDINKVPMLDTIEGDTYMSTELAQLRNIEYRYYPYYGVVLIDDGEINIIDKNGNKVERQNMWNGYELRGKDTWYTDKPTDIRFRNGLERFTTNLFGCYLMRIKKKYPEIFIFDRWIMLSEFEEDYPRHIKSLQNNNSCVL